jgi:hypothetical protein
MALRTRPQPDYRKIGDGEHSEVFRRPGSPYCVQLFTTDCPELTIDKVRREYDYLLRAYAELPDLIPWQRLLAADPHAHICETVLVKEWVAVDVTRPLGRIRAGDLPDHTVDQLGRFVTVTRDLLDQALDDQTLLPDIIDTRFQNLAVDTCGRLRLLDTNRLINTNALRRLRPGQTLDVGRHPIHALLLRRLLYLDAAFRGRDRHHLTADPVYRRYLNPGDLEQLFAASVHAGEIM